MKTPTDGVRVKREETPDGELGVPIVKVFDVNINTLEMGDRTNGQSNRKRYETLTLLSITQSERVL